MDFRSFLENNIVVLDGGMGTLLQERGLLSGELPEDWNVSHPEVITAIHKEYFDSGANVVLSNTFGANSFKFSDEKLELVIKSAIENAKAARSAQLCFSDTGGAKKKEGSDRAMRIAHSRA